MLSHICSALESNMILKHIDFGYCQIGNNEASLIANALKSNSTWAKLNLDGNPFDINGALAIAQGLAENKTIEHVQFPPLTNYTPLLNCILSNDVLTKCKVGQKRLLPSNERLEKWKKVRRDCLAYHQLFDKHIPDCSAELWRLTRALFRARADEHEQGVSGSDDDYDEYGYGDGFSSGLDYSNFDDDDDGDDDEGEVIVLDDDDDDADDEVIVLDED